MVARRQDKNTASTKLSLRPQGLPDPLPALLLQEGVEVPIHVMLQPDYLTVRVAALEDLEMYVEDLTFAKLLCSETMAVKRERPMKVCSLACAGSGTTV